MGQDIAHVYPLPPDGEFEISKAQITALLFESHKKAANTAEEVMCIKEIGKINGLYETKKTEVNINIEAHTQKLEVMSDEELLKLTGQAANLLDLREHVKQELDYIDAELVEED